MKWKTQTMELMKILSDPRRNRILHLAAEKPVTVKYLAEQIGEDPLKLYYHVKKLMKAELLEVAETRQLGNLTEKYYQSRDFMDVVYRGDVQEQAKHLELSLTLLHRMLDPALKLYRRSLEEIRDHCREDGKPAVRLPYHVSFDSKTERMTGKQWRQSIGPMMRAGSPAPDRPAWPDPGELEGDDEVGTYRYVLISYKEEDAERLGLTELHDEKEE